MTQHANLPFLFGRFTAILQDHEHLGTTLKRLRAMCAALDAQNPTLTSLEPVSLLQDLQMDLSEHFAAEEADSYFGTIADEAPALAPGIDQLRAEHTAMLAALTTLCRLASDAADAAELSLATRQLISDLERHERAESSLLRSLFVPGAP
ncbi:MAG TPA: hemerythrin domain-containing protein [Polyangiaceae bacterium]|nr:hemerythrin domain-containing protein [Polyangiaceae bacterium]